MKPPSKELVKAACLLSIEAKRALMAASEGEPGWLGFPDGHWLQTAPDDEDLLLGRVFLPCSEVAWMRAAFPHGVWFIGPHAVSAGISLPLVEAPTAPECALKAWGSEVKK
jgi:hypothetical protein